MRCFSVTSYAVLSAASILQIHSSFPLTDAFTNPATQRRQLSSPSVEGMFAAADHSSCQENDALSRSRRTAFSRIVFGGSSVVAAIVTVGSEAFALDMDAFINSQVRNQRKIRPCVRRFVRYIIVFSFCVTAYSMLKTNVLLSARSRYEEL